MNCDELERIFLECGQPAAQPLPADADEHAVTCLACKQLLKAFRLPSAAETISSTKLTRLAATLAADLLPTQPLAPMGCYLMAFAGAFASIVTLGVYGGGTGSFSAMSPMQTVSILCLLSGSASLLAWSLVLQMVPGSRHRVRPELLSAAVITFLSISVIVLFQFRSEPRFWHRGWTCIQAGLPFALLAAAPFWLLLRRGAIVSPRATGATAGLLAGLTGTSVLEVHCADLDLLHVLVSHFGLAALGALGGFVVGGAGEVFGRYMCYRSDRHRMVNERA
jgi:hypothetical protein